MDIPAMNEIWMIASRSVAHRPQPNRALERFEYLDIMGLFETGWMVYPHKNNSRFDFGYPK